MTPKYSKGPDGRKVSSDGFKTASFSSWPRPGCVAVKITNGAVQVRDTKDADDSTLNFTTDEWSAFIQGVKAGEFEL